MTVSLLSYRGAPPNSHRMRFILWCVPAAHVDYRELKLRHKFHSLSLSCEYVYIEEELKTRQQQQLHNSSEKMNEIPVLRDREKSSSSDNETYIMFHLKYPIYQSECRVSERGGRCCVVLLLFVGRMKRKWKGKKWNWVVLTHDSAFHYRY